MNMRDQAIHRTSSARVLLVDDDSSSRLAFLEALRESGFLVDCATNGLGALSQMTVSTPDVVVTGESVSETHGLDIVSLVARQLKTVPVILLSSAVSDESKRRAIRRGVTDLLERPVCSERLVASVRRALDLDRADRNDTGREPPLPSQTIAPATPTPLGVLLGESLAMRNVRRLAALVAPRRTTVLITGESGTGKGELARAIHGLSPRAHRPFVAVHCAALVETLLESELFGHERGAFTGADRRRLGRFEMADGGTLFLDEIGEVPPTMQVKLLQVLQERTFERVGGTGLIPVDVRLIAATNRNLSADVAAGRFREDLFYRLDVVRIEMPRVATRGSDVLLLAEHFLQRAAAEHGRPAPRLSDAAKLKLLEHPWPGNVRELENTIERSVALTPGDLIDERDLELHRPSRPNDIQLSNRTMADIERDAIIAALADCGSSTARAAQQLGISIRKLQYRLHQYGLTKARKEI